MAIEPARGCGYRKVGGIYLVGSGYAHGCDRLPLILDICPVCSSGVKFSRGITWINLLKLAGVHGTLDSTEARTDESGDLTQIKQCKCTKTCYICYPKDEKHALLWVGESFYKTPSDFIDESVRQGISKRIAAVPRGFKVGETIVLLAHKKAITSTVYNSESDSFDKVGIAGIITCFIPSRIEKLIWKSEADSETIERLQKQGITPVIVPDGDADHDPETPRKVSREEITESQSKFEFGFLRDKLSKIGKRSNDIHDTDIHDTDIHDNNIHDTDTNTESWNLED
jgi:hypothetical protein